MKYLHTMVRVGDLDASLDFYCNKLGLVELRRHEVEAGRFTLVFLAAPGDADELGRLRDAGFARAVFIAPSATTEQVLPLLDHYASLAKEVG